MLKYLIVDDEKPAQEELKYLLSSYDQMRLVGMADNGDEALQMILDMEPDVVFMDINMPVISGIDVAEKIMSLNTKIVFVTAYDQYAIKAFELNALDYLLKPISEERLQKTVNKLIDSMKELSVYHQNIEKFIRAFKDTREDTSHVCLYKDGILHPVKFEGIICVYYSDRTVTVETEDGPFKVQKTLAEFETCLPAERFFKCHRSYIINLDYVEEIVPWFNRTFIVKMKHTATEIPVSRNHVGEFKKRMAIF